MAHPIVHFELSAQDPRAAGEWYNNLFGWPVTVSEEWNYVMVTTQERFGGGFNPVGPAPDMPNLPAGTSIVYIATDDLDATVQQIEAASGVILMARQDLPGVGSISLFKDLTGNIVGLIQPDMTAMENAPPPAQQSYPHPIVHFELSANDPQAAGEWYNRLFGWPMSHFPEYNYVTFATQEKFGGGFADVKNGMSAGTTVIYIETDDIAATVEQVEAAGATILMRGDPIPGVGVIGMFRDPTGNTVGLLQPEMPTGETQLAAGQAQTVS